MDVPAELSGGKKRDTAKTIGKRMKTPERKTASISWGTFQAQ
jgi:hypothetical protein